MGLHGLGRNAVSIERVGSDSGGESCSILFSKEAGKYNSNRKNRCRKYAIPSHFPPQTGPSS